MKTKLHLFMTMIATVLFGSMSFAQCPAGQGALTVDVTTDTWGYECYWEITPVGDACGTNTVAAFGNIAEVGCGGEGAIVATAGNGYASSTIINEDLGCLPLGTCFDLHYVDDYADDGAVFSVMVDGIELYNITATGVYTICVTAPAGSDAGIDSVGVGSYYNFVPMNQVTPMSFEATITNFGTSDVTNAMVTATVNDGTADVHTATSTAVATLVAGASSTGALTADYTPVGMGLHTVSFVSSITEVDEDMDNDTMTMMVMVNDSVLGRDDGTVTGALGFNTGAADNGQMALVMSSPVADDLTSITAYFDSPTSGDSTKMSVYDVAAGLPTTALASTATYTFTDADTLGVFLTLPLSSAVTVAAGADFALVVNEYNFNVSLATNATSAYEAGTNLVISTSITTDAWVTAESLAAQFGLNYVLRANFATVASIGENALNTANVYPNPTKGNVTVTLSESVDNATATVYSVNGTVVSSEVVSGTQFSVNLDGLTNGLYIMELNNGSEKGVYRIVKD